MAPSRCGAISASSAARTRATFLKRATVPLCAKSHGPCTSPGFSGFSAALAVNERGAHEVRGAQRLGDVPPVRQARERVRHRRRIAAAHLEDERPPLVDRPRAPEQRQASLGAGGGPPPPPP